MTAGATATRPRGLGGRGRRALAVLLVLLAAALAYAPTLGNGFLDLDDDVYVFRNEMVREGLTPRTIRWALTDGAAGERDVDYWQPATLLSRLLDATLFGMNPAGHHLTNLLLHGANAVLILLLLAAATGRLWRSAFVALVFAVHPLHVSSVAWVTERKDVLSLFFSLATLAFFARFAAAYRDWLDAPPGARAAGPLVRRYLLLAAGYALALMSKPATLPLPLAMLVVAYWPIPRERRPGLVRLALSLSPLLLPAAAASFLYARSAVSGSTLAWFFGLPLLSAKIVVTSLAAYPVRLLLPVDLQHLYTVYPESFTAGRAAWSLAVLGLLAAAAVAGERRRPYLAAGWLWYLVWFLPMVPLFVHNAAADRFAYAPVIGLTTMLAWAAGEAAARRTPALRRGTAVAAAAAVIALAAVTRAECRHWKDSRTLFTHLLEADPRHYIAHRALGFAYGRDGDHARALASYEAAIVGRRPGENPLDSYNVAVVYNNIGHELDLLGRKDEAYRYFTESVAMDPGNALVLVNLGKARMLRAEFDEALEAFHAALKLEPRSAAALHEIGRIHAHRGRHDLAADYLGRALEIDPESLHVMTDLGQAHFRLGDFDRAAAIFQRALDRHPDDFANLNNLGGALLARGERGRAKALFERALLVRPGDPRVLENLRALGAAAAAPGAPPAPSGGGPR